MNWRMVLNITNWKQDVLADKAYFPAPCIPFGIFRNCLIASSPYSLLQPVFIEILISNANRCMSGDAAVAMR